MFTLSVAINCSITIFFACFCISVEVKREYICWGKGGGGRQKQFLCKGWNFKGGSTMFGKEADVYHWSDWSFHILYLGLETTLYYWSDWSFNILYLGLEATVYYWSDWSFNILYLGLEATAYYWSDWSFNSILLVWLKL